MSLQLYLISDWVCISLRVFLLTMFTAILLFDEVITWLLIRMPRCLMWTKDDIAREIKRDTLSGLPSGTGIKDTLCTVSFFYVDPALRQIIRRVTICRHFSWVFTSHSCDKSRTYVCILHIHARRLVRIIHIHVRIRSIHRCRPLKF